MKHFKSISISVIFVFFFVSTLFTQAPDTLWTRTYGGDNQDIGYSIEVLPKGEFIIVGETKSFGFGNRDVYLIKTDSLGEVLWTKTYGGIENDGGRVIRRSYDGGFIIAGYTESFDPGVCNIYLIKIDSLGDIIWTRTYGGIIANSSYSVKNTIDNGYIIAGKSSLHGFRDIDFYIHKLK